MRIRLWNFIIVIKKRPFFASVETKSSCPNKIVDDSWYSDDYELFKMKMGPNSEFPLLKNYPCLNDKKDECGAIRSPYFAQDLFVARKIFNSNPEKHVDVGSSLYGFVSHVAAFRSIEVFDIRPMTLSYQNIIFKQADITDPMSTTIDYCDSVSSLHALEHFGLGRYGDKIDPDGHLKGFAQITRILKSGGTFYFSVPMGVQRIEFNAHRIFGMPYLMNWVTRDYSIASFAYVDDNCVLHEDAPLSIENIKTSFGCNHGCAIFELIKNH